MSATLLGALAIGLAYLAAWLPAPLSRAAPWLMAGGTILLLLGLLLLGTRRSARRRPALLILGLSALALLLLSGFGAALLLPAETAGSPLLLGLPRRAALLVYGIGLLPVLFLPLVYAFSFATGVLDAAELEALRTRLAALRDPGRPP